MIQYVIEYYKNFIQVILFKGKALNKKSAVLRIEIANYEYLKKISFANARTMSGQANLIFKVMQYFQNNHEELYFEILKNLEKQNHRKFTNNK